MDRLWSPWRMEYIERDRAGGDGCPFCYTRAEAAELPGLVVATSALAYVILNLYPYNGGHLLVVPYRHVGEMLDITPAEFADITGLLQDCVRGLRKVMNPAGFNIGLNLGAAGGAGMPDHLHFHVVPRWEGDTNFMPVVGETKVMPETLEQTKARLVEAWQLQADSRASGE
ncbi:MAG: HIT domain-containing protein [Chloroflexota bacterium]|jgi:ATP adenylyltransferase|nr:HIT domain-containing protein [Chloroflexota bacterium]MDP6509338.1 HIT domain-containing protein [Chloroflexota bacterium]MDP6756955.1 HIT domain-containing protein [Chloroflexota bacterium]